MDIWSQEKKETRKENLCERGSEKSGRRDKRKIKTGEAEERRKAERSESTEKHLGKTGEREMERREESKGKICKRK